MCGICGIFNFGTSKDADQDLLRKMCDTIRHRGPDDEGYYTNGGIGLGMRRLAIIDLHTGQQPISNEERTIWVVNNGEIYNFQQLRETLIKKGHRFYTRSDTEVIVHLYEDHGVDFVNHLRGMFAFAIWDANKNSLVLGRDRLGKKPLNYALRNGTLIFGSEIKSILEHPHINKDVDLEALDSYLTYQYIPSPLTIFRGIQKLPPASTLTCDKNGNIDIRQYWDIDFRSKLDLSEEEYGERILHKLKEATKLRMISDVPLGAFLSGGIDSSAVVGLMSELSPRPIKTFAIGFEDQEFSELKHARLVADHFRTDHTEFVVKPKMVEVLPKLIWHYGEPYADSSAFPSYYLARETRKFVTVALCGDGGDENFAGYLRYRGQLKANSLSKIYPFLGGRIIAKLFRLLPESTEKISLIHRANSVSQTLLESPAYRNIRWYYFFRNYQKEQIYSDWMKNSLGSRNAYDYMAGVHSRSQAKAFLDKLLYTDIKAYLAEDLLVKMDIATMANSLEVRSPFLDHEFMEFTAQIPPRLKLKGRTLKYILKKCLKGFVPEKILSRPKWGFGPPVGRWFRSDLKDYVREILLDPASLDRGYFDKAYVKQMVHEHIEGGKDHTSRIWALLMLELWHKIYIDGDSPISLQ
jgi:asparagine synthase (glutamine-hydrolysing)